MKNLARNLVIALTLLFGFGWNVKEEDGEYEVPSYPHMRSATLNCTYFEEKCLPAGLGFGWNIASSRLVVQSAEIGRERTKVEVRTVGYPGRMISNIVDVLYYHNPKNIYGNWGYSFISTNMMKIYVLGSGVAWTNVIQCPPGSFFDSSGELGITLGSITMIKKAFDQKYRHRRVGFGETLIENRDTNTWSAKLTGLSTSTSIKEWRFPNGTNGLKRRFGPKEKQVVIPTLSDGVYEAKALRPDFMVISSPDSWHWYVRY